ncbi:hypothetical protein Tsubulata_021273 [Turnera subulata]|uniref:Methyltransferase-like protein n=1 Tax=Turnera subulata TaxID=218843 RepID=A0A9Q0FTM5_9ROSI|nr:hypothetical protein Tsubulata_021273 [Turnera subulata]
MSTVGVEEEETKYFSKDFEWETLRQEIENNPSYRHHLLPFAPLPSESQRPQTQDSAAWQRFHLRHSSGKFFKARAKVFVEGVPRASLFPRWGRFGSWVRQWQFCYSNPTCFCSGNKDIVVYACDCSNETLERARENVDSSNVVAGQARFRTFCCDFAATGFPRWLVYDKKDGSPNDRDGLSSVGGVDFVTMVMFLFLIFFIIFTLSAVPLKRMPAAIMECFSVLKPGGLLLFRDYGLYDMTMLRFEPDKRVGFREYMRSDGTRSYFFCLDAVRNLFAAAGFNELELEYCCVMSVNRQKGKSMRRVWVHGKFQKPLTQC